MGVDGSRGARWNRLSWREHTEQGVMTFAVEAFEPPRRMVGRIADKNLPFGGAWEYVLAPDATDPGKTRVTITERGYVTNPIFRFVSRFLIGHYSTLDTYLKDLGRKFGNVVAPTRVRAARERGATPMLGDHRAQPPSDGSARTTLRASSPELPTESG